MELAQYCYCVQKNKSFTNRSKYVISLFQVRGTIFNELDDDRLHSIIDFSDFEERFKIGTGGAFTNGDTDVDGLSSFPSKRFKRTENVSLLEHTRLRNIGKYHFHLLRIMMKSVGSVYLERFQNLLFAHCFLCD